MIDLNGSDYNSPVVAIFNNGVAGRVENVNISVEKKDPTNMDNQPDYKVHFTDNISSVNMGIYYPTDQSTDSQNKILAQKCADLTKSVMGYDFVFPAFGTYKELVDFCMRTINANSDGKKVNIIATYGTVGSPKKYLGVYKNFNFVEAAGTTPSKITIARKGNQYDDLLERVVEDAPADNQNNELPVNAADTVNWASS